MKLKQPIDARSARRNRSDPIVSSTALLRSCNAAIVDAPSTRADNCMVWIPVGKERAADAIGIGGSAADASTARRMALEK
jgi:hypothetical protein